MTGHNVGLFARFAMLGCLAAASVYADPITCGPGTVQLTGSATFFCVNAFGYSNTWYSSNAPDSVTDANRNLLGASAQYLTYKNTDGATVSSWLGVPTGGAGVSNFGTSESGTLTVMDNVATSTVGNSDVSVAITSTVIMNNIKQTFTITNLTTAVINYVQLVEYFQYFPFGNGNDNSLATLNYELVPTIEQTMVLGLWAHGEFADGVVRDGGACGGPGAGDGIGCNTPDHYILGDQTTVLAAVQNSGTGMAGWDGAKSANYTSTSAPAGALSWTAGPVNLSQGQSTAFTVELVPEPATFAFMLIGGAALWFRRRRA